MIYLQKEDFDQKNNILNSHKQTKKYLRQHIFMIISFFTAKWKLSPRV